MVVWGEDMKQENPDTKDKIILPESLQREMIKFFLRVLMPDVDEQKRESVTDNQQTSPKKAEEVDNG